MPTVDPKSLRYGDILITATSNVISHCGLLADASRRKSGADYVEVRNVVLHATDALGISGIEVTDWVSKYKKTSVFRCNALGMGAVEDEIAAAAASLKGRCKYGRTRAFVKSWTGTSSYGPNAKGRLAKYMLRLGTAGTFVTTLYCSEFVVLAYQIAAKGDEAKPYFIALDGKHSLPKDLRNWLLQRTVPGGTWRYLGDLG